MHESTLNTLNLLEENGGLALSAVGRPALREMQPLLDGGVLAIIRRGAGQALQVRNPDALRQFRQVNFPEQTADASQPTRATAVRTMRNAKQAKSRESTVLLLRAFHPILCTLNGQSFCAYEITQRCGAVALVLEQKSELSLSGEIALIENLECFLHAERMQLEADAAIYTAGRLSGIALSILGSKPMGKCTYLHCPDYDPVGLAEYMRYFDALNARIKLHEPPDLEQLLKTYGKPTLLHGRNGRTLQTLRQQAPQQIRHILRWIDEANAGLEQEILIQ